MAHRSLGIDAGWHQVLPVIGVDAKPVPMPMLVRCPHCGSPRMRIYDDTRFGGHWHYCPSCKASGDMIELAARVWKCNLQQAVARLITAGIHFSESDSSDSIAGYEKDIIGIQTRSRALLADGATALAMGHVNVGYIIQQLGLLKDQDKPYWRRRLGRFMAGCNKAGAVGLIRPVKVKNGRSDAYGKFMGKGWGPMVAIPFHDLPDRFAGWLFVGRQARNPLDYEFIPIDNPKIVHDKTVDIGLCMYEVLDSPTAYSELFGNTVFVFNDPIHALKFQSRHMRDSDLPLPLVSAFPAKITRAIESKRASWELVTRSVWQNRTDKRFVFWSAAVTPDVFNNASRADGCIHICKTLLITSRNPAHIWLQIVQRNAKPWMEVLEKELLAMDEHTACDFVANLDIAQDLMQRFLHTCDDKLRQLLEKNRSQVRQLSTAVVNGKRICETPAGWTLEKTGELICNAILRIDKIVSHADEDDPYYVGRITVDGKEVQFSSPYSIITHQTPGRWLHNKIIKTLGKAPIIKRAWESHILDVARHFHPPVVVCEDGRFGWKPTEMSFSLPQFTTYVGGRISTESAHVLDQYAPGTKLAPPTLPPPEFAKLARECVQNELFWAMTACIGCNIIAPALGHPLANVGIIGQTLTGLAYSIARKAGCASIDPTNAMTRPNEFAEQMEETMRRHNWPVMLRTVRNPQTRKGIERWLNSSGTANGIAILPGTLSMLVPLIAPWRFVSIPAELDLSPEAQLYGELVIPLWLQRLCAQKLELKSNSDDFVQQVLDDMADMLAGFGGNPENIRVASRHIDDASEDAGHRLVALLHHALTDGIARFVQPGVIQRVSGGSRAQSRLPEIVRVEGDTPAGAHSGIFFSNDDFIDILDAYGLFIPSPGIVTDALANANALDCRCEYNGRTGWLIIERWWHRQVERCRADQKRLTVVGGA